MSDGSSKDIVNIVSEHAGWVAAVVAGTWGVVLRAVIGRYSRNEERHHEWIEQVDQRLMIIERSLAVIEERSHDRRREDIERFEHRNS